jgi:hypothetical protein
MLLLWLVGYKPTRLNGIALSSCLDAPGTVNKGGQTVEVLLRHPMFACAAKHGIGVGNGRQPAGARTHDPVADCGNTTSPSRNDVDVDAFVGPSRNALVAVERIEMVGLQSPEHAPNLATGQLDDIGNVSFAPLAVAIEDQIPVLEAADAEGMGAWTAFSHLQG